MAWKNCLGEADAGGAVLIDNVSCIVSDRRVDALPAGE